MADQTNPAPLPQGEVALSTADQAWLDDVFRYHAPEPDQIPVYHALREAAKAHASVILRLVPACADRSAALRSIREAGMTANAAVARKGRP
jgi:hypothetical protein